MGQIEFTPQSLLNKIPATVTVAFQRFEKFTSDKGTTSLYCFVEGQDLPYYNVRVEALSGKDCCFIDSGGKKNVIELCQMLKTKSEYDKYKKLFFVDRDYDNNEALNKSIFVTPCYSVENFYSTDDVVDKLFKLPPEDPNYNQCKTYISERFDCFSNAVLLFCAWYYCVKQKEQRENIICNVDLDDSVDKDCVQLTVSEDGLKIDSRYSLDQLNQKYGTSITDEELNIGIEYIKNDFAKNIRGKYIFQFLEKLLEFFNIDSSKKGKHTYLNKPLSIDINRKKMMNNLTNIAKTPIELRNYVNQNLAINHIA